MSDMLQHNTSLGGLHLRDDSAGEEGVHQLINSLKHNQTLRQLWLPEKYNWPVTTEYIDGVPEVLWCVSHCAVLLGCVNYLVQYVSHDHCAVLECVLC